MINKELEVGDCVYIPYEETANLFGEEFKPFMEDMDASGNLYLMIVDVIPWQIVTLMELRNEHGTMTVNTEFIEEYGVFVKHKEIKVSKEWSSDNEVLTIHVTNYERER